MRKSDLILHYRFIRWNADKGTKTTQTGP